MADQFSETVNQFDNAHVVQPPGEPVPVFEVKRSPSEISGVVVVKDGYSVQRLEGPKEGYRAHELQDLTSMADWLLAYVPEEKRAQVEIFVGDGNARAILDPRHHEISETIGADMAYQPVFQTWKALLGATGEGNWISQKELFRQFRRVKSTIENGHVILQKIQKAGVIESMESESELSDTGGTTLRGTVGRKNSKLEIPESLELKIPVYLDAHARDTDAPVYPLSVIVETEIEEGAVRFRLVAPEFPQLKKNAQVDAATFLQDTLGEGFHVVLGRGDGETRSRVIETDLERAPIMGGPA